MKQKQQFSLDLWNRLKEQGIPHTFETRDGENQAKNTFNTEAKKELYPIVSVINGTIER